MLGDIDIYFDIRINDLEKINSYKNEIDYALLNNDGDSLLHYAVKSNSFDCVRFFIKNISPNVKNKYGETPLFYAAKMGKIQMIRLLLRYNADVNIKNNVGETALMPAIIKGDIECVKLLIESKSVTNIVNNDFKMIGHYAIIGGYNIFTYLHKKKYFNIDYKDDSNNSLLHYAFKTNNIKIIKYILKYINPNVKNNERETPLFNAIRNDNKDAVKQLFVNGAIIDLKNKFGERAYELATIDMKLYLNELIETPKYKEYIKKYPQVIAIINEDMEYLNNHIVFNIKDSTGKSIKEYAKIIGNDEILKLIK